jgi:hypothetical protein
MFIDTSTLESNDSTIWQHFTGQLFAMHTITQQIVLLDFSHT